MAPNALTCRKSDITVCIFWDISPSPASPNPSTNTASWTLCIICAFWRNKSFAWIYCLSHEWNTWSQERHMWLSCYQKKQCVSWHFVATSITHLIQHCLCPCTWWLGLGWQGVIKTYNRDQSHAVVHVIYMSAIAFNQDIINQGFIPIVDIVYDTMSLGKYVLICNSLKQCHQKAHFVKGTWLHLGAHHPGCQWQAFRSGFEIIT